MAVEMALVGEARGEGGFRDWRAFEHELFGFFQPPHDQVAMRAGAVKRTKMSGQRKAVHARCSF